MPDALTVSALCSAAPAEQEQREHDAEYVPLFSVACSRHAFRAAVRNIRTNEGFGTFYRGIVSPIMAEAPKRAIKFASNDQYKVRVPSAVLHCFSGSVVDGCARDALWSGQWLSAASLLPSARC